MKLKNNFFSVKAKLASYVVFTTLLASNFHASAQSYKWGSVSIGGGGFVSAVVMSKTQQNVMYARTDVGGAYRWDAANSSWIPLNDWASQDETGYLGVESIAIDPQTPGKVYMSVGISYFNNGKSAILRSSDYGNTFSITDVSSQFKVHGNGMGRQNGEKLQVDPNNSNTLYCGSRWNGLFRSTNAGVSWSRLSALNVTTTPNENGISFVVIDKSSGTLGNNSQRIFVGVSQTGNNLYMSTNGGASFSNISGAPTNYMPQRGVLDGNGNLIITYANGAGPHGHWSAPEPMDNGQIWKYNIANGMWTNITPSGFTRALGGISVDPNNSNRLIATSVNTYMPQDGGSWGDRVFLSTNGGSSWTDLFNNGMTIDPNGSSWIYGHAIHWAGCVEFNPFNTNQVYVTSGNGIFVCDNITAAKTTWRFSVKGLEETVPLDIVSLPNGPLVSVIGDYDGFIHTDVTQYPPIHTPRMGTTTGLAYAGNNTSKLVRVGDKMYFTNNQGTSWTQTATMNGLKGRVALSADGNTILHNPEKTTTMYRSTNNGSSWSTVTGISINEAMPVADLVNSNKFYAYDPGSGNVLISTNAGASFSNASNVGSNGSKIIRTVPGKEGHVWVALYNGGLTRSTNSAQSFTKLNNVSYCAAVGFGKAATGANYHTIYIWGTVNNVVGVYRSTDEGVSWTRINDDNHEYGGPGNGQFVIGDMNIYGRVYLSTAGRGIAYGEPQTTNMAPSVTLSSPSTSAVFCAGQPITLTANATDSDGTISKVEFYDGNTLLSTVTSSPYSYNWINASVASHSITAKAYDNANSVTTSAAVSITVHQKPTITITSPTSTSINGASSITFAATTTGGNISNVKFYNNNSLIAEDVSSPYSTLINNLSAGDYMLMAVVTNQSNCTDTASIRIGVITSSLDQNIADQVTVYPNPFDTQISVATKGDFTYQLFDLSGIEVQAGYGSDLISLGENLSKGMYVLKIFKSSTLNVVKINKY